jgi:hypothetical protein
MPTLAVFAQHQIELSRDNVEAEWHANSSERDEAASQAADSGLHEFKTPLRRRFSLPAFN